MLPCVHIARPTPYRIELTLTGEIDIASAAKLGEAADLVLAAAARDVWLDLRRVTFFSAVGLRFLLDLKAIVAHHEGNLTVAPIPRCVALVVQASAPAPDAPRGRHGWRPRPPAAPDRARMCARTDHPAGDPLT